MKRSTDGRRTTEALEPTPEGAVESAAANLFDLRVLIGGLFVLYGLVLIIAGAVVNSAELHKAADININLWMGIGMLVLGALFLLWWRTRPLKVQPAPEPEQPEPPKTAQGRNTPKQR